jgi:hypothetical protein
VPCLTADALTNDPKGMAFLRDVLAQPASDTAMQAKPPAIGTKRRVRRGPHAEPSERKPSVATLTPTPAEAAA